VHYITNDDNGSTQILVPGSINENVEIPRYILHTPLSGSLSKCISASWYHTVCQCLAGRVKSVNESENQYGFQALQKYTHWK